jgi:hypothetical protein
MGINKFYLCIDIKNMNVADDKNSIDNISTKYFLVDNRNVAVTRHSLPLLHNTSLRPLHPISSCHTTLYQRYSRLTTTLQCSAKQTTYNHTVSAGCVIEIDKHICQSPNEVLKIATGRRQLSGWIMSSATALLYV